MNVTMVWIAASTLSVVSQAQAQQAATTRPPVEVADFEKRVKAYADLRNKVDGGAADLMETKDSAKITAAQEALAQRIRAARADAKPGAIFTPEIRQQFRMLLRPELKGKEGAQTKAIIEEESPDKITLQVNAKYPENEPVSTVPPNILLTLPKLPDDLEYRFAGRHLILRDNRANLIVDYIPNALPEVTGGAK